MRPESRGTRFAAALLLGFALGCGAPGGASTAGRTDGPAPQRRLRLSDVCEQLAQCCNRLPSASQGGCRGAVLRRNRSTCSSALEAFRDRCG